MLLLAIEGKPLANLVSHHLQSRVDQIYDHLYANSTVRTPAGIAGEVGKILHCGMYIEQVEGNRPAFQFDRAKLRSLIAQDSQLCGFVAASLRKQFAKMNASWRIYQGDDKVIQISDLDLGFVAAKLDGVYLTDPTRDVFGDVVEIIRSNWAKRIGGQFFTDQRVTALSMNLLKFDPRKGDDIVDLCAGTGGFLLAAVNHVRGLLEKASGGDSVEEKLTELASASIKGVEVDEGVAQLGNASLATRLGSLSCDLISRGDSLRISNGLAKVVGFGRHMCAASNPPFGATITIKDPALLSEFELASTKSATTDLFSFASNKLTPRAPDILFLEQNIRLLKPGHGRLAIVLPYQVLSGPQTLFVREWLLKNVKVLAVVDLPSETFQPHTGTKTTLLVVKRRKKPLDSPNEDLEGTVFMSMPKWIGHDRRGNPIFRRREDGTETDDILSDFPRVAEAYSAYLGGTEPKEMHAESFSLPYSRVVTDPLLRTNALFHKPLTGGTTSAAASARGREWRTVKVREVVKRLFYPGRFRRDYVPFTEGVVPFLGGANITELVPTTDKWLRSNDPKLEALTVKEGWILVTRSGSTGIVSSVPKAWDGFAMSEHVIRIVPDPEKLSPHYLMIALRTQYVQELLRRGVFGSVIDEITPEFIGELEIPIPPKAELARLSKTIEDAERSRQNSIEGITATVAHLNEAFQVLSVPS